MFTAQQNWILAEVRHKKKTKKNMGSTPYFYLYESSVRTNLSHKSYTKTQTDVQHDFVGS